MNRRHTVAFAAPLLTSGSVALVFIGCGDVYADPPQASPTSVPTATSSSFSGPPPVDCPPSRPRENTLCFTPGTTCEYGESADQQCNSVLACRGAPGAGDWEPTSADPCHARVCPIGADIASIEGQPCTLEPMDDGGVITDADEAICNMNDGLCACTTGPSSAHPRRWVCIRPISACPSNRPLAGQFCAGQLWCDYGSCDFKRGLVMQCQKGVWLPEGRPCP